MHYQKVGDFYDVCSKFDSSNKMVFSSSQVLAQANKVEAIILMNGEKVLPETKRKRKLSIDIDDANTVKRRKMIHSIDSGADCDSGN